MRNYSISITYTGSAMAKNQKEAINHVVKDIVDGKIKSVRYVTWYPYIPIKATLTKQKK